MWLSTDEHGLDFNGAGVLYLVNNGDDGTNAEFFQTDMTNRYGNLRGDHRSAGRWSRSPRPQVTAFSLE